MNRRSFLKSIGILSVGIKASLAAAQAENLSLPSGTPRPNILWISCEDISPHLGCYGEKYAFTPNIDQIAKEGIRYTRAFTVHGVCAPSRSGIITGMYPSCLGTVNMRCRSLKPDSVKCFTEYLREVGYYCTNNSKEDYNFKTPETAWDESGKKAHWKNRPDGNPFFAVFNFTGTHESGLWSSADFDSTHPKRLKKSQWQKPENMTVPPIYPDTIEVRRDFARLFEKITDFDYFVLDRINELNEAGLYQDTIIFIWSDHGNGLPRAKRWLYDSGTLVPLLVRVPERYRIPDQAGPNTTDSRMVNFIDLGPTVLNLAGIKTPEHMQGQAFLGSNLPSERKYIFGARQRIDELYDMVRSVRDEHYRYVINFMPYLPYLPYLEYAENCNTMKAMRMLYAEDKLNNDQAQWMASHRPPEELYDLTADPWEIHNLAKQPKYANVKKRLRQILENWMVETHDTGLIPESEMIRLAKEYGSEYLIFQQPGSLDRINKLTSLAIISTNPQPEDASVIEAARTSDDPINRYWAALAMRSNPDNLDKLSKAAQDKNPSVRIAAAQSLSAFGHESEAIQLLERELKDLNQQEEVLHYAMSVLVQLGPEAYSMLPTVQTLQKAKGQKKYLGRLCEYFINKMTLIKNESD